MLFSAYVLTVEIQTPNNAPASMVFVCVHGHGLKLSYFRIIIWDRNYINPNSLATL